MAQTQEMLRTHPIGGQQQAVIDCIDACYECSQTCTICADACLGEPMVANLVRCIRLDLDCAAICRATGEMMARRVEGDARLMRAQLEACAEACRISAEECERHAMNMEHCRICAAVCRRCEDACRRMLEHL